jgi:Dihydroorotase and related cyclic amidohydrolases
MGEEYSRYDTLVSGWTAVLPDLGATRTDIAVRAGRSAAIADQLPTQPAEGVIDSGGKSVLPGHWRYLPPEGVISDEP